MAHQVVECSHCSGKHSRTICDRCERVLVEDDAWLQLSTVMMCGSWPDAERSKQHSYGTTFLVICRGCAVTVRLVDLVTNPKPTFEDITL